MMKYILIFLSWLFVVVLAGISPACASAPDSQQNSADTTGRASNQPTWEIPIAAGVWYPGPERQTHFSDHYY
jgi:hypothetical protein